MPREVYCRRKTCHYSGSYHTGREPRICPRCREDARWSTMPGQDEPDPRITFNDRGFLHSLKIDHGEQEA